MFGIVVAMPYPGLRLRLRYHCDMKVEVRVSHGAVEPDPQREDHLHAARRRDVSQIDDVPRVPAEPLAQGPGDRRLRFGVVAADEHVMISRELRRVDHHDAVHGVQCLDDSCLRKLPLDLLAQRVGVADRERRGKSVREVERVRDVDDDLPVQVVRARHPERFQRSRSRGAVEDDFAERRSVGERADRCVLSRSARPFDRLRIVGGAGTHHYSMAEFRKRRSYGLADDAGAEDCDVHSRFVGSVLKESRNLREH